MKIGFDVAQTCGERAGCAWYADSLARALVKGSPQHEFFLYHQFGDWINPSTDSGTRIDAPNVTNTFTDVTPAEARRIWTNPAEIVIKTGGPEIVHATSYRAPKVPGAKLVYTVYDVSFWAVPQFTTDANRLVCQEGTLQALQNADGFAFISQNAHDEFERLLPGWLEENGRPWAVTPLAPRTAAVADRGGTIPSTAAYWLAVGTLEPRKNYGALLDAVELYWASSRRRIPLHIAGGAGWKSQELRRRIEHMAGQGMVKALGYVADEDLPGLYAGAEALLFPSSYEGFGLPVVEAMNQGCPVVTSNATSLPEVGGDAVLYFKPEETTALATHMLQLESDSAFRTSLAARGRRQAREFTWERTAIRTLDLYHQVIGST